MKKLFSVFSVLFLILALSSCSTCKRIKKPPKFDQVDREYLKPFNNKYLVNENGNTVVPDIVVQHTIFYASEDIVVLGEFSEVSVKAKDGVMFKTDSLNRLKKIVLKRTPGTILSMKRDRYGIQKIQISFDEDDQDYTFWFVRISNGNFAILETGHTHWDGSEFKFNKNWTVGRSLLLFELYSDKGQKNKKQEALGNRAGALN